jgi:uncharacterized protein YuzB (UPF0349 family)
MQKVVDLMARYIDIEGAGIGKANREQFLVPEFADGWNAVLKILDKEPTADVVEVKCKCADCKHYQRYGRTSLVFEGKNVQAGWCMLRAKTDEEHRMLPTDFCSYGERKEQG